MGLVLTLKPNEIIYVGDTKIQIAEDKVPYRNKTRRSVKLFFEGPSDVPIFRRKVLEE